MPLDVWIYGSGFGESILLIWDTPDKNERHAAFIDAYGGSTWESHPALRQWKAEGCPPIDCMAITHPHLDHIRNASVVLDEACPSARALLWWGGHGLQTQERFLGRLIQHHKIQDSEPRRAAHHTYLLVGDLNRLNRGRHIRRPDGTIPQILEPKEIDQCHECQTDVGPMRIHSISPWLIPQKRYTDWLNEQIVRDKNGQTIIRPSEKGVANSISLGFLIEYGEARVFLGGDMEKDNWGDFNQERVSRKCADALKQMHPCLIKVSHHGSNTGVIPGMWEKDQGFFGWRGNTEEQRPHCVVTPWRAGNRKLPDETVLQKIAQSGCHVWQTGHWPEGHGIDKGTRPVASHVHFRVDGKQNHARKMKDVFCHHLEPSLG